MGNKLNASKKLSSAVTSLVNSLSFLTIHALEFIMLHRIFILSFVITVVFYLPALKSTSINAGFLYGGDVLGWYLPALAKTHELLHAFNFTAIDYSTFNGSSDFFLSPNFFSYHPLVVIFCLIASPETTSIRELGNFLVLLMAVHSFLAFYFSLKLFSRFFDFEFGSAALIATVFTFSAHVLNSLGQPPFLLCASIIPWAVYSSLAFVEKPNFRLFVFASLPVVFGLMGGYLPMGVACLALSGGLVAIKIIYLDGSVEPLNKRVRSLFIAVLPYICGLIIVGPYVYSLIDFHHNTSSAGQGSLFYSAHQYAQVPAKLLTVFSSHFHVPGTSVEYSLLWGLIPLSTAAIFIFGADPGKIFTAKEWKLFKISALIYFATLLATFGNFSVVSDLVYYLVPQVGRMHVYQRFFLPAELLFAIMFALMLKAVIDTRPLVLIRVALGFFTVAIFMIAYLVAYQPDVAGDLGLNNYIVIELFIALIFLCVLLVPGKNFIYSAVIILFLLPIFDRMYDYSHGNHSFQVQSKRQPVILDETVREKVVSYFSRHSNKDVIKYIDITPMWVTGTVDELYATNGVETFPKTFPDYVLNELRLSSYGGFTFYLSARADYMRSMPVVGDDVAVKPNWDYLMNTGADYIIVRESDLESGALGFQLSEMNMEDVLRLPNYVVIIPLKTLIQKSLISGTETFDNGFFRITPEANKLVDTPVNIALGKSALQSSDAGAPAERAVDGNTNGEFSLGSVSHTLRDTNAWLEIDLGTVEPIDHVTVWNRTDCCGYCLQDYWLFISEQPFLASDTAADLNRRAGTWARQNFIPSPRGIIKTEGIRGRYVRIQLPGDAVTIKECFLSIAEIEVFRSKQQNETVLSPQTIDYMEVKVNNFTSNFANYSRLDFEVTKPSTVQYLFWDNPRIKYYLNGGVVEPTNDVGVVSIDVPVGVNTIEVKYRHWPLMIFWFFYISFGLVLFWTVLPAKNITGAWRKLSKR